MVTHIMRGVGWFFYFIYLFKVEAATDSESEGKGSREFHSVGIQVEDDKKGWANGSHRLITKILSLMFDLAMIHKPCFQCYYLSFCGLSSLPFNSTDREGSNAPTAWLRPCRPTWSWSAFPPWRTRACSSVGVSNGTRSPAHPPNMELYGQFVPRAFLATATITAPQLSRPVPERPPAKPPGS